jgi:hypothetical protein
MLFVFALTLFTSATLLFLIEPMVGKMVTPLLGGTPAVWNTCMVFFQALLLAGYAYAHATTAWLGSRKQALLHLAVLVLPAASLALYPLRVSPGAVAVSGENPIPALLLILFLSVGVPFFVVSATAPLLQNWFSSTAHPAARDPYFLYGASNLGSMLALLGYPTVVEPNLRLDWQRWGWCAGYAVLALMTAGCAVFLWRAAPAGTAAPPPNGKDATAAKAGKRRGRSERVTTAPQVTGVTAEAPSPDDERPVTLGRRLRWLVLAAVPSSLMLGVTTYMTTDIAAIPLLWVLPLAIYLLTFILVFARISPRGQAVGVWLGLGLVLWGLGAALPELLNLTEDRQENVRSLITFSCVILFLLGALIPWKVRDPNLIHRVMTLAMPLLVLLLLFLMLSEIRKFAITHLIALHLATLFAVAMVCHGELARDRPAPRHLTEYFLWMSAGGVVGGLFNALVAPLVFNGIVEYQLALVVACLLVPPLGPERESRWAVPADIGLVVLFLLVGGFLLGMRLHDGTMDLSALTPRSIYWMLGALLAGLLAALAHVLRSNDRPAALYLDVALPLALGGLVVGLYWGLPSQAVGHRLISFADLLGARVYVLRQALTFGVPVVLCYTFIERPVRFGLSVGALALAAAFCDQVDNRSVVLQKRSFFGVLKVEEGEEPAGAVELPYRRLMHGTTMHGKQFLVEELKDIPSTYYHYTGPVGELFAAYNTDERRPFAVIGLGTGTMACYARKGQHVTFYDIDPVVRGISYDTDRYFTYVQDARDRGADIGLVMGDARLTLERQQLPDDEKYAILVVDAFSSDAIPIHLITWEALQMYWGKMRPDGIVFFHISNRYLDLQPVLANFAAKGDLDGLVMSDDDDSAPGKARSTWVALARKPEPGQPGHLDRLMSPERLERSMGVRDWASVRRKLLAAGMMHGRLKATWEPLKPEPAVGVWTDDYSNLWSVFNRK